MDLLKTDKGGALRRFDAKVLSLPPSKRPSALSRSFEWSEKLRKQERERERERDRVHGV
jgi:hypothetical protein